jgi:hypothetical protein
MSLTTLGIDIIILEEKEVEENMCIWKKGLH